MIITIHNDDHEYDSDFLCELSTDLKCTPLGNGNTIINADRQTIHGTRNTLFVIYLQSYNYNNDHGGGFWGFTCLTIFYCPFAFRHCPSDGTIRFLVGICQSHQMYHKIILKKIECYIIDTDFPGHN